MPSAALPEAAEDTRRVGFVAQGADDALIAEAAC
jgi:hypothetical protein